MINNTKTDSPKRNIPIKFLAVIRADDTGRGLTIGEAHLSPTVAHETKIGRIIVGEYIDLSVAERAVRLALRGWRRCPDASKTGT